MELNSEDAPSPPGHPNLRRLSKEELAEILDQHQIWLDSKGTKGRLADLGKTNLRGISLVGLNLAQANLKDAYLYGAYFKKTCLHSANCSGVNLRTANLRWANLQKADLRHANLMKADLLNADLRETDLSAAKHLQCEQLKSAIINQKTKLPSYLKISWISESSYKCFCI